MRVLQINSIYRKGSTGRTTYEVEKALVEQGHEAFVAYGYGEKYEGYNYLRINSKLSNNIHKVMSRLTGLEGYFSFFSTKKMIRFIKKVSPDVIHLRCLHGDYLNLPVLFGFLKKYDGQVFMNLHDCWDFTGHCPYFGECDKWKTECNNCDKYKLYPKSYFIDTSRKIYKDKIKWYSGIKNLNVIAVSKWLKTLGEQSILKNRNVHYLYNWINQEIFNASYRNDLADKNFSVLFVSASWEPGTYRYEMLRQLILMLPKTYNIKIVGIYRGEPIDSVNVEYLGYVGDERKLADIYANSSVYVHLSKEEAFGKVIAEANACGIPAIVFDVSGCAEVVSETSGYKVPVDDLDGIVDKIHLIEKNGYDHYSKEAIENVNKNFNYPKNVKTLIGLYEEYSRQN